MRFLIVVSLVLALGYIALAVYQSWKQNASSPDARDGTDEWDCPECGFHVQLGDECIYCGTEKPKGPELHA